MTTYQELLEQKRALDSMIAKAQREERADAIATIRELVLNFSLTEKDVFSPKKSSQLALAKFRDPLTGSTWSGRGKPPRWIADKDRASFAI